MDSPASSKSAGKTHILDAIMHTPAPESSSPMKPSQTNSITRLGLCLAKACGVFMKQPTTIVYALSASVEEQIQKESVHLSKPVVFYGLPSGTIISPDNIAVSHKFLTDTVPFDFSPTCRLTMDRSGTAVAKDLQKLVKSVHDPDCTVDTFLCNVDSFSATEQIETHMRGGSKEHRIGYHFTNAPWSPMQKGLCEEWVEPLRSKFNFEDLSTALVYRAACMYRELGARKVSTDRLLWGGEFFIWAVYHLSHLKKAWALERTPFPEDFTEALMDAENAHTSDDIHMLILCGSDEFVELDKLFPEDYHE